MVPGKGRRESSGSVMGCGGGGRCGRWLGAHPRCGQPQVSIAGQFPSPLAVAFAESTFVFGLHPPGAAFDEPRTVPGSCLVAADVGKLRSQLFEVHSLQRSDLVCQSLQLGFTVMQLGFTVIPAHEKTGAIYLSLLS